MINKAPVMSDKQESESSNLDVRNDNNYIANLKTENIKRKDDNKYTTREISHLPKSNSTNSMDVSKDLNRNESEQSLGDQSVGGGGVDSLIFSETADSFLSIPLKSDNIAGQKGSIMNNTAVQKGVNFESTGRTVSTLGASGISSTSYTSSSLNDVSTSIDVNNQSSSILDFEKMVDEDGEIILKKRMPTRSEVCRVLII